MSSNIYKSDNNIKSQRRTPSITNQNQLSYIPQNMDFRASNYEVVKPTADPRATRPSFNIPYESTMSSAQLKNTYVSNSQNKGKFLT